MHRCHWARLLAKLIGMLESGAQLLEHKRAAQCWGESMVDGRFEALHNIKGLPKSPQATGSSVPLM